MRNDIVDHLASTVL